jgi:hypothetical protein
MKTRQIIFFLSILFLILLPSCKKIKLDKLEDMWKVTKVSETEVTDVFELWDFEDGVLLRLMENDTIAELDTVDQCKYEFKYKPGTSIVQIQNCSEIIYNADWKVLKLRSTKMILLNQRDGMFLYREFEKYQ